MTIHIWKNFNQMATLEGAWKKKGRNLSPQDLSLMDNGTIIFDEKQILWVGKGDIPEKFKKGDRRDCQGLILLPELVDSHTHLLFGGDRAEEYQRRMNGEDYQRIAREGGGILSTVKETRASSGKELFKSAVARIDEMHSCGVGTVEIKSGYGLEKKKEEELSFIINDLKKHFSPAIQIHNTFMAAHAVPREFKTSREYIKKQILPLFEKLAGQGIIDSVDIFHERGYFDISDVKLLFDKAKEMNISRKIHADEFYDNEGASLACEYNALSADHLLATSGKGIKRLADSETVAVLLPGTGLFLGKGLADARAFLDAGCRVAMASDYNPGSCHCSNLLWLASVASPSYKLNMAEFWASVTLNAAAALGLKNQGALVSGLSPRFTVFRTESIAHITYRWGERMEVVDPMVFQTENN